MCGCVGVLFVLRKAKYGFVDVFLVCVCGGGGVKCVSIGVF